MDRLMRASRPLPGAFTTEATAALRALTGSPEPRLLLGFYPSFVTNPYQALLYGAVREHGIAPVRLQRVDQFGELEALQAAGIDTALHLHWLHPILADAAGARDADRLVRQFLDRIGAYRAAGGRVVWTVHNILPHETRFESAEAQLSAEVAARSDVIHVLAGGTRKFVAPYYDLPADRILHVPHPSYRGAYQDHVSRLDARHELGLMPDELVLAVVGAIRPYKGLNELMDAWAQVDLEGPRRLLIAGASTEDAANEALVTRAAVDPRIIIDPRKIPADEMQLFLRAADVVVLPYRRSLNSGALMLALTFGLPVIVPAGGGLAEVVAPSFSTTFEPDDPASLVAALREAPALATADAARAAAAAAAALDPTELSHRFASGLLAMLREGNVGTPAIVPAREAAPLSGRGRRSRASQATTS
jgi:beta-1,4-mannosyltransferase